MWLLVQTHARRDEVKQINKGIKEPLLAFFCIIFRVVAVELNPLVWGAHIFIDLSNQCAMGPMFSASGGAFQLPTWYQE